MSLPTFKFTNFGAPTNNESVNSGLSAKSKIEKTGILTTIKDKAQDTFKNVKMPDISLDIGDESSSSADGGDSGSFFSFASIIKFILIIVIVWFMWGSLSDNRDFHLGVVEKVKSFFKSLEEKGRELVSRITSDPVSAPSVHPAEDGDTSDEDNDEDSDDGPKAPKAPVPHHPPVPPGMSNSSDKKPGFINDDSKYTFLDKANRSYTGPSPRADDSTSVTQKHQAGKAGYCYIGEDRGFRSCVKVEAGDKCMSGQTFSRQDICVNPTLRE